jgi:hypothetical protein
MDRIFPTTTSAAREGSDTIRIDGWNEDGSGEGPRHHLATHRRLTFSRELPSR